MGYNLDNIVPEDFDVHITELIPEEVIALSEMHSVERSFINGLVRLVKPTRILEIGVAEGGGTAVLLNAISDMPDATVTSVDIMDFFYKDPTKKVGFAADMMYPDGNPQWSLFSGKDFSEIAEELSGPFDFCVIDTAHQHPIETLNFLTVLPFLSKNAIVVFHDSSLFIPTFSRFSSFPRVPLANKLCYDTVVGRKIKPIETEYLKSYFNNSNIGAVQISEDTWKYIHNTFNMLSFPWSMKGNILAVARILRKYYKEEYYKVFCDAAMMNLSMIKDNYQYIKPLPKIYLKKEDILNNNKIVFYGAGTCCQELLDSAFLPKPIEIWDVEAERIGMINGIPVIVPRFEDVCSRYKDALFVITVLRAAVIADISKKILDSFSTAKIITYCEIVDIELIDKAFVL